MSSIGVGIQKIAIHSQLIGLKTALKISDIMKKIELMKSKHLTQFLRISKWQKFQRI